MNSTYETMLALLRGALWEQENVPEPERGDMEAVAAELKRQHVQTLCADVLGRSGDRDVIQAAAGGVCRWYAVMNAQSKVLSWLAQADIPTVVLKGAAVDRYYPRPEYRAMGDVDLLVKPEDFDRAAALLEKHGCQLHNPKDRHYGFSIDSVSLELHRHFTLEGGRPLDSRLYDAMARRESAEIQGYVFPVLPETENALVLLEHIKQHLQSGMGLRQLLDWMFYAHRCLRPEGAWERFAPVARMFGLEKLAVTATYLCCRELGLPEMHWCRGGDEALSRELLSQLLERGNFGEKDIKSSKTVEMLNLARHPAAFLREMQTIGCRTWKVLKKHPYLKCFAWLYQICRLIRRGFGRDKAISRLREDVNRADQLQRLLDGLELS